MFLNYILILWLCWLLGPPVQLFLRNVDITKKCMIAYFPFHISSLRCLNWTLGFQLEIIVPPNLSFLPITRLNEPSDNSTIFVVATEHKTGSKQFKTAQSYVVLLCFYVYASSHMPYTHTHTHAHTCTCSFSPFIFISTSQHIENHLHSQVETSAGLHLCMKQQRERERDVQRLIFPT